MKEIASRLLTFAGKVFPADALPELFHDNWCVGERAFLRFGDHAVIFLAQKGGEMRLGVAALREKYLPANFVGEKESLPGGAVLISALCDDKNASALRRHCPKCAPSFPADKNALAQMEIFSGDEAQLACLRDRLTFAAFADGMHKKYVLCGVAKDPAVAARLLEHGATCIVFAAEGKTAQPMPEEYRGRRFVLSARHAVKITGDFSFGEVLREAEKIAGLAAAKNAAWMLQMTEKISVPEHLVLARELYCRKAAPLQWVAPADEKDMSDHAAIAAQYGKYEFKTVENETEKNKKE